MSENREVWVAADRKLKVMWGEELDHAQIFDSNFQEVTGAGG
jgi:hypothetical protein